ncbi:hypothetical protein G5A69_09835 [Ralstonia mannitolilytica]|nr:hypothetical protein G5A69_09835 [Ralstonia mannitolilytica]
MNRTIIAVLFAIASIGARASCLSVASEADNIATMRDNGSSAKDLKAIYAADTPNSNTDDLRWQSTIIDAIYKNKVKPWNAIAFANSLCNPQQKTVADTPEAEKAREMRYRDSFNRMPNIPGICVGDECGHIRKIQHWDANGNMTN